MSSQPAFIQVGALADGFAPDSNILPVVQDLSGRTFTLGFADGSRETLTLLDGERVRTAAGEHAARVTSIRPGIYFIDFIGGGAGGKPGSTSVVIDERLALCTVLNGHLPAQAEAHIDALTRVERNLPLTSVTAEFRHGRLVSDGVHAAAELHAPTRELIGMRNMYTYSATERYEHVYLNENFYAWQCLAGVEAGLADVDRCYTIRIAEKLYLFVWCEKIVPTLGVVMIDLERMKTDGKIFGYQGSNFGALSNFPVGAFAQVLNTTRYPQ
ncbi:MoaF C-terminal domain-containing protein [Paraburkholderia ferrariae]|jgi:hypothetical protein|uniref:MoaF C-terminal domain-containing protein n=1 Tax=Paraburkholderia ferrariae TaxID=386056 RepID=UPI000480E6FF|nr:MoaF C-terminal domain-containing protein [Paraburkholderia ferrariae]